MGTIIPFSNPLAFPGGLAQVNPSHPASSKLVMSAISPTAGGSMININTGAPFTNVNGFVNTVIDAALGPALYISLAQNTQQIKMANPPGFTVSTVTCAAMVRPLSIGGAGVYQSIVIIGGGRAMYLKAGQLDFFFGGDNLFPGVTLSANVPYFVATSFNSGNVINGVIRNMATGAIQSGSTTTPGGGLVDNPVQVGSDTFNEPFGGYIAAAMYSNAFLSLPQLLLWAQDPWAFWYPQFDLTYSLSQQSIADVLMAQIML